MPKKIAVFCDGTWNEPSTDQTNVVKLFEATAHFDRETPPNPQIACYVRGVGTSREERWRGGTFGYGISDRIKQAYAFIVSNFVPGDKIYLFGFSRGAFTARSLAGLIRNVGILRRDQLHVLDDAYRIYRDRTPGYTPNSAKSRRFRENHSHLDENTRIEFVGVWDSVGALGAPYGIALRFIFDRLFHTRFHDMKLSSWIHNAYHALAVDERRWPFRPALWELDERHIERNVAARARREVILPVEQTWFPGVHSNVGGGYAQSGLSDIALKWMAERAEYKGLRVDLHEPPVAPQIMEQPQDSQTDYFRWLTKLCIYYPGRIGLVQRFVFPKEVADLYPHIAPNGDFIRPIDEGEDVNLPKKKKVEDPSYDPPNIR